MACMGVSDLVVLVVEPSPTQRRIIRASLAEAGVQVVLEESGGDAALSRTRSEQPDLVISALYLPDMTGTNLVHRMRADTSLADVVFMLISSETRFRLLDPIRQAGAIAILPKPFATTDLKIALSSTLALVDTTQFDPIDQHEDLRVLVVDDSSLSRKYIIKVLQLLGITQVEEAVDGSEALQLIDAHYFDFVVTDYNMPRMDGRELVEAIRRDLSQSSLPVLMVTSENNSNRLAAVQQAGVSAICDKPFSPATVRQLIHSILNAA